MYQIYLKIFLALSLLGWAACSSDTDTPSADDQPSAGGQVRLTLRLDARAAEADGMRAAWSDTNATDGEMMKSWFVIAVQDGVVQQIVTNETYAQGVTEKETDEAKLLLQPGETTFYAFANLRLADLPKADGVSVGKNLPADFEEQALTVAGNQLSVAGFSTGIPMTGKNTVNVEKTTRQVSVELVRMVAKVRLELTNITAQNLTVQSVTLSDVTANKTGNLLLLAATDGDNKPVPHLNADVVGAAGGRADYTFTLTQPLTLSAGHSEPVCLDFYVNESEAVQPKYFVLALNTAQGDTYRYAMLEWKQIARNDYRVIPVRLGDWRMAFEVEAFTPIGVLPQAEFSHGTLNLTFGTYGDFHIRPVLTRLSTGAKLVAGTDWGQGRLSLFEANPQGGVGENIYDAAPAWNAQTHLIEGAVGLRTGYALHEFSCQVNDGSETLTYRIQVNMDASDYQPATRQTQPRCWQKVRVVCPSQSESLTLDTHEYE